MLSAGGSRSSRIALHVARLIHCRVGERRDIASGCCYGKIYVKKSPFNIAGIKEIIRNIMLSGLSSSVFIQGFFLGMHVLIWAFSPCFGTADEFYPFKLNFTHFKMLNEL